MFLMISSSEIVQEQINCQIVQQENITNPKETEEDRHGQRIEEYAESRARNRKFWKTAHLFLLFYPLGRSTNLIYCSGKLKVLKRNFYFYLYESTIKMASEGLFARKRKRRELHSGAGRLLQ